MFEKQRKRKYKGIAILVLLSLLVSPIMNISNKDIHAATIPTIPTDTWIAHAATAFAGGTGSEADPYQIKTPEQLAFLADSVNKGTTYDRKFIRLDSNIDLKAYRWTPIGNIKFSKPFQGNFDGNQKSVSGLRIDETGKDYVAGLFGNISNYSDPVSPCVKNLNISDAVVIASEEGQTTTVRTGILAAYISANDGVNVDISNVTVDGIISNNFTNGLYASGGLVGEVYRTTFTDCKVNTVSISGGTNSGGFVGQDADSTYTNCSANGSVQGNYSLGGFVAYSTSASANPSKSIFTNCSANVDIEANDWRVGGFAGYLAEKSTVNNCVAYGNVSSYVEGWNPKVGGFVGENNGIINNSYATGKVTSLDPDSPAGGFVGNDNLGVTNNCMFDKTINPTLNAIGVEEVAGTNNIIVGTTQDTLAGICVAILGGHTIDTVWSSDATNHWHVCSVCNSKVEVAEHTLGNIEFDATNHWYVCTICNTKVKVSTHTPSAWIIDKDSTETETGLRHKECIDCHQTLISEEIPMKPTPVPPSYKFIKGENSSWKQDSTQNLEFVVDGNFDDFVRVEINSKVLDTTNYTAKSGSTIIQLKSEYLKSLQAGTYEISIIFTNETANTKFVIEKKSDIVVPGDKDNNNTQKPNETPTTKNPEENKAPQTGDTSNSLLLITIMGTALLVIGTAIYKLKDR